MGRKGIKSKLLMCAVAASTIVTGILGSVPLPVRAAEEEKYTVTFEAYEGTCETESISVPKGESLTLPEGTYEGHYLESWMDVTDEEGNVVKHMAVGRPGDTYTPERDLWLYANWKPEKEAEQEPEVTVSYEARIGETYYGDIESAFENAQEGDTVTVLKDCSSSKTLVLSAGGITLTSEDAENPAVISRDSDFAGKNYQRIDMDNVLLGIEGSLMLHDIILDGGAELDSDFNNSGQAWDGPMVYVTGECTVEDGTVLRNNYNTNNNGEERTSRSAGAVHVEWGGTFNMNGGLIHHCYTNGGGGGIQTGRTSNVTITGGTVRDCRAYVGGAVEFYGPANVSGMTISGNKARAATVGIHGEVILSGCLIENNEEESDGGIIGVSENFPVVIEGCIIRDNRSRYTSAISYSGINRTEPLTIRDCTITGNVAEDQYSGSTVTYMTKAPLILDGKIIMEGNTVADGKAWDIRFYYQDAAPFTLGQGFESDSVFVLWGRNSVPGTLLVDAASNGKEADASQFVWKTEDYRTEEREGNIYLAEIPKTYRIGYNANNNDEGPSKSYTDPERYNITDTVTILDREGIYPFLGSLEKKGFDFAGWNTKKDGTGIDYIGGEEIRLSGDTYLYAKWEAKEPVTLTYIYNGGTGGKDSEQAVPGLEFTFPDAVRKGYSLKGWYEDKELSVFAGAAGEGHSVPEKDSTYYAAWEKADAAITFDPDGGKMEGGNITAKIGDTITLPACTKDGYEFAGWYDNDLCVGQAGEAYTVSDDVILKAHYIKKEAPVCTVSFDTDGGKEILPIKVEKGQAVKLPEAEKNGHIFLGWYTEKESGEKTDAEFTVVEDIMVYAHWEKEAERPVEKPEAVITFDADGGEMQGGDITAKIGDTITLPSCTKDGCEFTGWYDNDICVGQAGQDYAVTGDVILKAHYIKKEAPVCTVSFDTDGGKEILPIKVEKEQTVKLPEAEKDGHIFLGWYTEKEDGEKTDAEFTVTEDIILFAHWEKEAEKPEEKLEATISFDADGGEMEGGDITAKIGDTITLPACTKDGYEFTGWYDNDACVGAAGEKYTVTGDVTLKARYEKKAETACLITFDPNGGRKAEHIRAAKGEKITLPGTEKSGYVFLGWYTEKKGGILLGLAGDEMEVAKDMTVYALWEKESAAEAGDKEPETCKAVFHTGGGTLKNKDISVVKGAGLYLPMPEKEGYEFAGWYLDKSLKQFAGAYRDVYRITKDTDFYAKWEKADESNSGGNGSEDDANHGNAEIKETYTIKYDANGGTVKESYAKVEKGTGVKLPSAEREGFSFKGWHTGKQVFIGKAGSTYKPDKDITLFAKWEKITGGADNGSGNGNGSTETGNSPGAGAGTSETAGSPGKDSGAPAAYGRPDEKADASAEKTSGTAANVSGTAAEKEPVIQTGRTSPVYLLAALGMCGILLAAFSICEGKRSSGK